MFLEDFGNALGHTVSYLGDKDNWTDFGHTMWGGMKDAWHVISGGADDIKKIIQAMIIIMAFGGGLMILSEVMNVAG